MRAARATVLGLLAAMSVHACAKSEPKDADDELLGTPCTASDADPARAESSQGFFTDISEASGIQEQNFVVDPPQSIPINDHSRLAFVDLDGDGWDDVVMHSLFPNPNAGIPFEHLVFRNQGDGTFRNVSDESGLRDVQAGFFVFADVDGDGDSDCFAGLDTDLEGHTSVLLLNDGQGHFTPRENSGLETRNHPGNAVFGDFNNDGKVDLFLGNGQTSYAERDQLFFGNGDGTFVEVSADALPRRPSQPTNGLVACDYDNDGDLDVLVATYGVSVRHGWNQLWENDGQGNFTEVAEARGFHALATGNYWNSRTGKGTEPQPVDADDIVGSNAFGIDCGDIDGDGVMDIYMAAISHADGSDDNRLWSDPTQLLLGGRGEGLSFENEFLQRGLPFNEGDIDAAMVDFDNDGRLDLSVTRDDKYEGSYTTLPQKAFFGLYWQRPDGSFADVGMQSGINEPDGPRMKRGQNLAWADIDHDGDPDLLVGGRDMGGGRPNFLFRNELGQDSDWLALRVFGDGKTVHTDAFGARVTVRVGGRVIVREKKSSRGTYDSIDGSALLFGLGASGACQDGRNTASLEVRWPNGEVETFGPEAFSLRSRLTLRYGEGTLRTDP